MLSLTRTAAAAARRTIAATATNCRWASTLLLSEPVHGNAIPAATCAAVTAAQALEDGSTVDLILVGNTTTTDLQQVPAGVNKVYHYVTATTPVAETVAAAVAAQVASSDSYSHVMGTSTKFGSTVIPRVAALLGVSPVTDILQIKGPAKYIRPLYAGNALCQVESKTTAGDSPQVISIRPTSFEKAALQDASDAVVETVDLPSIVFAGSTWVGESVSGGGDADDVDLGSASVVVSGGRGLQSGDNFAMLKELAAACGGGAVGASRAAVDAGMVPNDMQVGQTGKVVAPDLYIAVGISGAIQHLSGMKDSKTIVAINKDPEAPIFQVADYGLVADLFTAVPELTEKLQK